MMLSGTDHGEEARVRDGAPLHDAAEEGREDVEHDDDGDLAEAAPDEPRGGRAVRPGQDEGREADVLRGRRGVREDVQRRDARQRDGRLDGDAAGEEALHEHAAPPVNGVAWRLAASASKSKYSLQ